MPTYEDRLAAIDGRIVLLQLGLIKLTKNQDRIIALLENRTVTRARPNRAGCAE